MNSRSRNTCAPGTSLRTTSVAVLPGSAAPEGFGAIAAFAGERRATGRSGAGAGAAADGTRGGALRAADGAAGGDATTGEGDSDRLRISSRPPASTPAAATLAIRNVRLMRGDLNPTVDQRG